ncbi:glycosyltransferase family 2 protein [Shewanella sedimentimangrovi]|uniref:Glycosyltransferase family 2 protein n=1 Tax=Shewanella sedimentimangrovi TaxID=2814293 RepID=A0ABX7QZR8_9GAMM|nr:glycosyltransferase family 2 protein [Shewanella sedimentimangrovi]QSX37049.1 glycosyltransferase family 2 protein [Shewanella sedimentimangrovi]
MRLALVIPNYNHSDAMSATLERLAPLGLPVFVINDGSNDHTRHVLQQLAQQYAWVTLLHHPYNRGKGAAVMTGLRAAYRAGFTHALQVDADGQHNLDDIPAMIALARANPEAVISGLPQYDASIPKGRLYGRYITHFWVWVETLSFDIQDSMCGFRIYPLAATEALFQEESLGERMDFDIEVLVRLFWRRTPVLHLPTRVIYPEGGISHFQGLQDNLRISWLHTRLFFGMLKRLPQLLSHRPEHHWASIGERGSYWGIRLLAASYRLGGHWLCRAIMYPVIGYFFLTGSAARQASQQFLNKVLAQDPKHPQLQPKVRWYHSFKHFIQFGNAALDRIDAWCQRSGMEQVDFPERQSLLDRLNSGKGAILLASHLGNPELCRAISVNQRKVTVNVLVMTANAANFNRVLKQLNPDSDLNLIHINELDPSTSVMLADKVAAGELVVIAADRTPAGNQSRITMAPFFDDEAAFPQGPFILAGLLDCPVYLMFCLKEEGRYRVFVEPFADSLKLPRKERASGIEQAVKRYASRLEHYARRQPMQWFNFFDFWQQHKTADDRSQDRHTHE